VSGCRGSARRRGRDARSAGSPMTWCRRCGSRERRLGPPGHGCPPYGLLLGRDSAGACASRLTCAMTFSGRFSGALLPARNRTHTNKEGRWPGDSRRRDETGGLAGGRQSSRSSVTGFPVPVSHPRPGRSRRLPELPGPGQRGQGRRGLVRRRGAGLGISHPVWPSIDSRIRSACPCVGRTPRSCAPGPP